MGTEDTPNSDIRRLNAFVDGELAPSERAEVATMIATDRAFARAHATLARLKACIGEAADATAADMIVPSPKKRFGRPAVGLGLSALAACTAIALYAAFALMTPNDSTPLKARDAVVTLAALPARPVIPNLDVAGLAVEDVKVDRAGDVPLLVVSYRGPHGCRLDLKVWARWNPLAPSIGTSRHSWEVGDLAYELVARGMPGWRFALIAEAAERETRGDVRPDDAGRRLREARASAPPCTG
jgi:hypothetical protein